MDIDQSEIQARPDKRLALIIGCFTLALVSGAILVIAVLETDGFNAIKTAFYSAPLTDGVPRIGASAFRPRMIAMGVDGLIMAFVTWYLFRTPGQPAVNDLTLRDVLDSPALFALCGAALMSFVTSCFLKIPVLENACSLHTKEGFIDTLHPLAFALAAVLLILTVLRQSRPGRLVPLGLLTIAVALFVAAMEEISWGQTFLGWQTPETVASWNYQNETNLHNAFNFVMGRTYLALGIIGFLAISASILIRRMIPDHPLTIMLPTTPMFWGGLWLPPASQSGIYTDTEPFESILAILAVYYAVRLWRDTSSGTSSRRT